MHGVGRGFNDSGQGGAPKNAPPAGSKCGTTHLPIPQSNYVPADRGPNELDAVRVVEGLPHGESCELHTAGAPLLWERERLPRVPSSEGACFRLRRRRRTMSAYVAGDIPSTTTRSPASGWRSPSTVPSESPSVSGHSWTPHG